MSVQIPGLAIQVGWPEPAFQDPPAMTMFADRSGRCSFWLFLAEMNFVLFVPIMEKQINMLMFSLACTCFHQNEADLSKIKKKEATKLDR